MTPLIGNQNDKGEKINVVWATTDEIKVQPITIYPEILWKILEQLTKEKESTNR